jgi:hypothetical protein
MPYILDEKGRRVVQALENPDYDWRTPEGISQETDIDLHQVASILRFLPNVVQSSVPDKFGRALYTTREHYKKRQNIGNRILSLFSDRIK